MLSLKTEENVEKREKQKQKARKSQTATTNIVLALLRYIENFIFCLKTYLGKLSLCYKSSSAAVHTD